MQSALKVFHDHLERKGLKKTSQRDLILETLLESEGHLSADELYNMVRRRDPSVGHTTIYRTLKLLLACGLAHEARFPDGKLRFEKQYKRARHDHLVCTRCGNSIEFFNREMEELQERLSKRYDFQILDYSLRMSGLCSDCRNKDG